MSFNTPLGTGDFRDTLSKVKRRLTRSELTKDDKQSLQGRINNMRSQIDFVRINSTIQNIDGIFTGPNDFVFEPDISEVKMYNNFARVYGNGWLIPQTLNSTDYDSIQIGDSDFLTYLVEPGSYHYEPYQNINNAEGVTIVPDSAALDLSQFSVATWFRTGKDYVNDVVAWLVVKGSFLTETAGDNVNYSILISTDIDPPDHRIEVFFETSAGVNWGAASSQTGVNDDQWHHVVGTYDGSNLKLYHNGYLSFTTNTGGAVPDTTTRDLTIGGANGFTNYEGQMDQTYVWNNDLTATEVLELWRDGTVPQTGNVVYSNTFGGTGISTSNRKCWYAVPEGGNNWDWNIGHHPPSVQEGNSISLNVGSNSGQFVYYSDFGTDFDFTADNFSMGFWIYPTDLSSSGSARIVAARRIDANNKWTMAIADADQKLFEVMTVAGVDTKRQYDTALTANNWYYINKTWEFGGPTLSLKVNDNADTTSTKTEPTTTGLPSTMICFGNTPGNTTTRDFKGYLAFPMYKKHSTVWTTTERTRLYTRNSKSNTTEPFVFGYGQFG